MNIDDALYKAFLEQMQSLENFRMSYASAHPNVPMDRDDPDVRRLIEAMAFFSARTHRAGMRNIVLSHLRIFQQCFSYITAPLPAMVMLKPRLTGHFAETVIIPKGCDFVFSASGVRSAVFRTIHDLRMIPMTLSDVQTLNLPGKGFRVLLIIHTPYPRNDDIGNLHIHMNHLNNYKASLLVFHALKRHLKNVSVLFDEKGTETHSGTSCRITFGSPQTELSSEIDWLNPIFKERIFFHLPQQELYLNIECPPPPRNWSKLTFCLDLDAGWQKNMTLSKEMFHLHVTPAINLLREMAQPFICKGTHEEFPIRHPNPEKDFEIHQVVGVYSQEKDGMVPLNSEIISGGNASYEIRQTTDLKKKTRQDWLFLNFPDAFMRPRVISVDAQWYQPTFSQAIGQKISVSPYTRSIYGIIWEPIGQLVPHADNRFGNNMDNFMNLFTLKNKPDLSFDDLRCLFQAMGNVTTGEFQSAAQLLKGIRVEHLPPQKRTAGHAFRRVCYLKFQGTDSLTAPLVQTFTDHVEKILNAWIPDAAVEVRYET